MLDTYTNPLFSETVATVARSAKAALPNETVKIARAVAMVLAAKVSRSALVQGGWHVESSNGLTAYEVHVGYRSCTCEDFMRHAASKYCCKHILAAMIMQRTIEALDMPETQADGCQVPANDDGIPCAAYGACIHTPAALPEAPASVNVRIMLHGKECQLTLRDTDEHRLLERLRIILANY